jgi:hypothetical protein
MGDILLLWYRQLYPWSPLRLYVPLLRLVFADEKGVVRSSENRLRNEVSSWPLSIPLLVSTTNIVRYHADIKSLSTRGYLVSNTFDILDVAND